MVIIELSKEEAELFKIFREYQDVFVILKARNALELQHGKVVLNFANGKLQNVVKEEMIFHR